MNEFDHISTEDLEMRVYLTQSTASLTIADAEALTEFTKLIRSKRNRKTGNAEVLRGIIRFATGVDIDEGKEREDHKNIWIREVYQGIVQEQQDRAEIMRELQQREHKSEDGETGEAIKTVWSDASDEDLWAWIDNENMTFRLTESDRMTVADMIDDVKQIERRSRTRNRSKSGEAPQRRLSISDSSMFRVLIRVATAQMEPEENREAYVDRVADRIVKVLAMAADERKRIDDELSLRAEGVED